MSTKKEDGLYAAMTKGDWEAVEELRADADEDFRAAYAHYQADHDMPERTRMKATKDAVKAENVAAKREAEAADQIAAEREEAMRADAAALAAATSDNRDRPEG